jgi:two-component system, LytTR family, response regulator
MKLQTVIADDEPLALDLLKLLLSEHNDIQVVAECRNGLQVVSCLQRMPVDLLFLDIEMPELDGFEVSERFGTKRLPPMIFVTAHYEHAIRAFDAHAADYLTKPVESERLAIALDRVRRKIASEAALTTQEHLAAVLHSIRSATEPIKSYVRRFLVKDGQREILLAVDGIDWIEAADYYSCLHAGGRSYLLREPIGDLERKLDPQQFVRIHRSSIVRLDKVREIHREGQHESSVVLTSGRVLRMSRTGRQRLLDHKG